jgi:hypothetical protein
MRPVQVQNLGREGCFGWCTSQRLDEAFALKPAILVIAFTPIDVIHMEAPNALSERNSQPLGHSFLSFFLSAKSRLKESSFGAAFVYFMTINNPAFARNRIMLYLQNGDASGYLRSPFSLTWQKRFDVLDGVLAETARRANASGVPVVLIEVPSLQEASLLKMKDPPAGIDPLAFSERLRQSAIKSGLGYIDGAAVFGGESNVNSLYYVVDSHINAKGHALIARSLVDLLLRDQRAVLLDSGATQAR